MAGTPAGSSRGFGHRAPARLGGTGVVPREKLLSATGLAESGQPVAFSQRTGAPSPARRNGSSSLSQAPPSSRSSSFSRTAVPLAPRVSAARSLFSGTRMSPLALVVAENSPRLGV